MAEHYGTMTNLRLVLKTARIKPPPATLVYDAETISSHLKVHLKGNETLNIQDRSAKVGKVKRPPYVICLTAPTRPIPSIS